MEAGKDLNSASRETLLVIIAELRQGIMQLKVQLAARGCPRGMFGNKPGSGHKPVREKKPGRREVTRLCPAADGAQSPSGSFVVKSGPECGTGPASGWTQRTREVLETPIVTVEVTEHVFEARMCALCRKRHLPHDALTMRSGDWQWGVSALRPTRRA